MKKNYLIKILFIFLFIPNISLSNDLRSGKEVAETIWTNAGQDSYSFKKAHAVAYAQLVVVHMNILEEQHAQK